MSPFTDSLSSDLFVRLVTSLHSLVPFERAELALVDDMGNVRSVGVRPGDSGGVETGAFLRADYSKSLWPDGPHEPFVVSNAADVLDPGFGGDLRLLKGGARSAIVATIRGEARDLALLVLSSAHDAVFEPSHLAVLTPVVQLLGSALERDRLWSRDQTRHRRRARLESLLPAIAEALDVRQVFLSLAAVIQEIVPHDILAFALLTPDRGGVRVQAATHNGLLELPEYRFSTPEEALDSNWRFLLAYDLEPVSSGVLRARISPRDAAEPVDVLVRPGEAWARFVTSAGVRSSLRVPIKVSGRPLGGVAFLSRRPYAFDVEDGALASRIGDHVALALAHEELAREEKRIALAEERAVVLEERVDVLSRELARFSAHRAIGMSAPWKKALADATRVADTDTTVLITGESGTGKEVVARFIHRGSPRARGPFVALNCAALPHDLLESELFGHERGAFTGALTSRPGKIEQAAGGVLFLDEVGEMSPAVQAKFLRVLQEREYQRLGGAKVMRADIRVVAATNRDPRRAMETGALREDLYYRLSVFEIHLPPLRERAEDIPLLAEAFLEELAETVGRPAAGLSEDARELLLSHSWPGNVRELRNAIERAVILCGGGLVTRDHLPVRIASPSTSRVGAGAATVFDFPAGGVQLEAVEKELLTKALASASDNKSEAARLLGLTRGQFYSLLRRHGLTRARR